MEPALKLIITWKFGRAALSLLLAFVGIGLLLAGLAGPLFKWAEALSDHAVTAVSLMVAELVVTALEPSRLWALIAALTLDAVVALLEAWALLRRWAWGVWLVVIATSALVPFELYAVLRHPGVFRALVVALNVLIVVWLLRHALRSQVRAALPLTLSEPRSP